MNVRVRWLASLAGVAGFLGGLAACENAVERQRMATCRRAVPALVPGEAGAQVLRVGPGSAPDSVRVDYAVGQRRHWLLCRFNSGADLTGVTTDRTTLTGASLYLLKRYYLDTPDAERADPAGR